MLEHKKISRLDEFFKPLTQRSERGIYFYRINGCNAEIRKFIREYYEAARKNGVILEGGISNPTNQNLAYYQEQMGTDFQMNLPFLQNSLKKWLPRMNDDQRQAVSTSIYHTLDNLRKSGKPESVLKNVYIKFMCWLYYKFERITNLLGNDQLPKILYDGMISNHELLLISVLAHAGCDVILLQYQGDANYLKFDARSELSDLLIVPDMQAFPEGYQLKIVRQEIQEEFNRRRLYGTLPEIQNCTNAWLNPDENVFEKIRTNPEIRGTADSNLFYNLFCRVEGVPDRQTYPNVLFQMYSELKESGRSVLILDEALPEPTPLEVAAVRRSNPTKLENMIQDFLQNLKFPINIPLERLMIKAFVDLMLEESQKPDMNLNRLSNYAIYLLCWLKKYQSALFHNWQMKEVSCILYLGGCRNEKEAFFFRFLARLPVDVLILTPSAQQKCVLDDALLYPVHYADHLEIEHYPKDISEIRLGTTAFHAERELDTILYQDSGIYRNQQYTKANAVTLRTTFEEISLYWREEPQIRPNFEIVHDAVTIPVIFAKVSGVKDGDVSGYWNWVKELMSESPFLIQRAPFVQNNMLNPLRNITTEFLMNGRLQRERIRNHQNYQYGFLREEIQEHILDKLQLLLDQRIIKGTYENGTEYLIVSVVLNLNIQLIREIQKFDFTKKNPKLLYILANERMISLEDAIIMAFLNLIGFDILFLVPTGYQSVEKHFQKARIEEHQIGEYIYDLRVPNLQKYSGKPVKTSPFSNLFKKRR